MIERKNHGTGSKGCQVVISAENPDTQDTTSFYALWEVFMAVRAVCVRYNRWGYATPLGKSALEWELSYRES